MQYWNGHLTVSILNVNSVITFAYEHIWTILIFLNQFNGEKIIHQPYGWWENNVSALSKVFSREQSESRF